MKKLILASFIAIAALLAIAATDAYSLNNDGTVDVEGNVSAIPCLRNQTEACPMIFLFPKCKIEVYMLGGDKVETIELDSADALEMQKGSSFTLKLKPENYIFYIENKLNGQKTVFGPVEVTEDMNKMRLNFAMYNSFPNTNSVTGDREICLTSGSGMNCNVITRDTGLVINRIPPEVTQPQINIPPIK